MSGVYEPHTPLLHGSCGICLGLPTNLVHDDYIRRMVLHSLDENCCLLLQAWHHHAPSQAHRGMWNKTISTYLVGSVHNNHTVSFSWTRYARPRAQLWFCHIRAHRV